VVRLARDTGEADPALSSAVYPIDISMRLSTIRFVLLANNIAETPVGEGPRDRHDRGGEVR
jgi:TctA family transporter